MFAKGKEPIWERLEHDQKQKQQNLEAKAKMTASAMGIETRDVTLRKAKAFIQERLHVSEYQRGHAEKALADAKTKAQISDDEASNVQKLLEKDEDAAVLALYNVLRVHTFLNKYEADLLSNRGFEKGQQGVVRLSASQRKKDKGKERMTKEQREERHAAIEAMKQWDQKLAEVKHTGAATEEQKRRRKEDRMRVREQKKQHRLHVEDKAPQLGGMVRACHGP